MGAYSTYMHLQVLLEEKRKLDERITEVRERLRGLVPDNGAADGIAHVVTERRSTKWAEAARRIIDLLVADSKKGKAWGMIEQMTTVSAVHSYRPADQTLHIPSESEAV